MEKSRKKKQLRDNCFQKPIRIIEIFLILVLWYYSTISYVCCSYISVDLKTIEKIKNNLLTLSKSLLTSEFQIIVSIEFFSQLL